MNEIAVTTTRDDHRIAWFAALAILVHVAESALPSPMPGVKPGLANVVTIAVLVLYGWRLATWVALLRVVIGSIVVGTFLSPTFMLSFAGVAAAALVLAIASQLPGRGFGPIGFSLLASLAHMAAQFWTAYWLFIPHSGLLLLLPILLSVAALTGFINGMIVIWMLKAIDHPV